MVQVDTESTRAYALSPLLQSVRHLIVCNVRLNGYIKEITLRSSLLISNTTQMRLQVLCVDRGHLLDIGLSRDVLK